MQGLQRSLWIHLSESAPRFSVLQELQLYLSNLANQIDRDSSTADVPLIIILDDISDAASISEMVNSALTCKYHKW